MLQVPITTTLSGLEIDLVIEIRLMKVLKIETGEPRVILDDYTVLDVKGRPVPVEFLDEHDTVPEAAEELIEGLIMFEPPAAVGSPDTARASDGVST